MEPITLNRGEYVDVIVGGNTIRISADHDADGGDFVELGGMTCNLEGEQPGIYYPTPLDITTREQAQAVLTHREGTPQEHLDHCDTDDLIAAAKAPEGQPCADCGRLVLHTDDQGWTHVDPDTSCFLAR